MRLAPLCKKLQAQLEKLGSSPFMLRVPNCSTVSPGTSGTHAQGLQKVLSLDWMSGSPPSLINQPYLEG